MPRLDPDAAAAAVHQEQTWTEFGSAIAVGSANIAGLLIVIANLGDAIWLIVPAVLLLAAAAFGVAWAVVHHRRYLRASRALMAARICSLGDQIQHNFG